MRFARTFKFVKTSPMENSSAYNLGVPGNTYMCQNVRVIFE